MDLYIYGYLSIMLVPIQNVEFNDAVYCDTFEDGITGQIRYTVIFIILSVLKY